MNILPEIGLVVQSKCGHDRGRKYVIIASPSKDFVLVVDGRIKTLENPKLKRFKHLTTLHIDCDIKAKIESGLITDNDVVKLLI